MSDKGHRRGTHRVVSPQATWSAIEPLLESFGITRVADLTGLDDVGIPVFQAVRPTGETLSVSQGKGVSPDLARVSAVMEAIELWHAERVGDGELRGSGRDVGPLPYDLFDLNLMPRSLVSEGLVLQWLTGHGILTGDSVLVPRDCVLVSTVLKPGWGFPAFVVSSTGLASGNTVPEAILHGLYEVVERDCTASFKQLPAHKRVRLDLDTVDDADCRWLLSRLEAAGNQVEAFEITGPIGVPCFEAQILSPILRGVWSGAGCHLHEGIALSRAISEAAQSRLTAIAGSRDDLQEDIYTRQHELGLDDTAFARAEITSSFARRPPHATDSIVEDLAIVAERVCAHTGREPFAVDLTRGPHHVPVVKVFGPRLRQVSG